MIFKITDPPATVDLFRISLPYAVYGILIESGLVIRTAPIAKWMIGKTLPVVKKFVARKNGTINKI